MRVKMGLDPTKDVDISAAACLKDITKNERDYFHSTNREYGVPLNEIEDTYK